MKNKVSEIVIKVIQQYANYHVKEIVTNRFTHKSFIQALKSFTNKEQLSIKTIGHSKEGREIKSIVYGQGKIHILLWSQMHGNESTATRAILDLLNFLSTNDDFNLLREQLSEKLTIQFIPMLNPDGTERFKRRTSTEIDMNRDAIALQTPEGKILDSVISTFKPKFAFNLHDQRRFYNVNGTEVPSSISFLAPAYNQKREVNSSREKSMQLIAGMNQLLQFYIPKGVCLYNDTYNYRSFGDNIQAKGISTILLESGWLVNDMQKECIRKLNFAALLKALEIITTDTLTMYSTKDYFKIPTIETMLFDVLIKHVKVNDQSNLTSDIGINRTEQLLDHPDYYSVGKIEDIGDLSSYYGFETINAKGLTLVAGKTISDIDLEDISIVSIKRFLKKGILFIVTTNIPLEDNVPFPINIIHPRKLNSIQKPVFEGYANFLLVDKNRAIKYIVLNGFVMRPDKIDTSVNGLVLV